MTAILCWQSEQQDHSVEEVPSNDRAKPCTNQIWVPHCGKAKPKMITQVTPCAVYAISYPRGISGRRRHPPGPTSFSLLAWYAWCDRFQAVLKEGQHASS
jgi:hypothetical protein